MIGPALWLIYVQLCITWKGVADTVPGKWEQ